MQKWHPRIEDGTSARLAILLAAKAQGPFWMCYVSSPHVCVYK